MANMRKVHNFRISFIAVVILFLSAGFANAVDGLVVDEAGNVGKWSSIALDSSKQPSHGGFQVRTQLSTLEIFRY